MSDFSGFFKKRFGQFSAVTAFLNSAPVLSALGVPQGLQWQTCNFGVNGRFSSDWMHSMANRLQNVVAANYTVLAYSGKLDFICNFLGGRAWTAAFQWPGQQGFNQAPKNPWQIRLDNGTNYSAGTSQVRVHEGKGSFGCFNVSS
jgi:carboxypeptidase C (cathepsin A)